MKINNILLEKRDTPTPKRQRAAVADVCTRYSLQSAEKPTKQQRQDSYYKFDIISKLLLNTVRTSLESTHL